MALMKTDYTDEERRVMELTKPEARKQQSTQIVSNAVLRKNTVLGQIAENRQLIHNYKIIRYYPGGSAEPLMALMKKDNTDVNGEIGMKEDDGVVFSLPLSVLSVL